MIYEYESKKVKKPAYTFCGFLFSAIIADSSGKNIDSV